MNKIAVRTVELNKGHVDVYEKNGITLTPIRRTI